MTHADCYVLAELLVGFGRVGQRPIGFSRIGSAAVRGLLPRLALNGPCLENSDLALGAQQPKLGLPNAARRGWKVW